MLNLIYAEFLKMRRSMMALVSLAGAAVTPLITFTSFVVYRERHGLGSLTMEKLMHDTSLYTVILIGIPLFGVLATWLFNREFVEDTLKSVLVIPVSRTSLVVAKFVTLFIWLVGLSAWAWLVAVLLGFAGGFGGATAPLLWNYLVTFVAEGCWLYLLTTPIVLATLLLRNYVPVIILTVSITLVSIVIGNSEYRAVYPWTAILPIMTGDFPVEYAKSVPYVSIIGTSLSGFVASIAVFRRMDIQ
jgi:bacitracin transport system permease protein